MKKVNGDTYKPTYHVKGSRIPFTRKRTVGDLQYIEWLKQRDAAEQQQDVDAGGHDLPDIMA